MAKLPEASSVGKAEFESQLKSRIGFFMPERSERGSSEGWATFFTIVAMGGALTFMWVKHQETAAERALRCPAVDQGQTLIPGQLPLDLDNALTTKPIDMLVSNKSGELVITSDDPNNILANTTGMGPEGVLELSVVGNLPNRVEFTRMPDQNIRIDFSHTNCQLPPYPIQVK